MQMGDNNHGEPLSRLCNVPGSVDDQVVRPVCLQNTTQVISKDKHKQIYLALYLISLLQVHDVLAFAAQTFTACEMQYSLAVLPCRPPPAKKRLDGQVQCYSY